MVNFEPDDERAFLLDLPADKINGYRGAVSLCYVSIRLCSRSAYLHQFFPAAVANPANNPYFSILNLSWVQPAAFRFYNAYLAEILEPASIESAGSLSIKTLKSWTEFVRWYTGLDGKMSNNS